MVAVLCKELVDPGTEQQFCPPDATDRSPRANFLFDYVCNKSGPHRRSLTLKKKRCFRGVEALARNHDQRAKNCCVGLQTEGLTEASQERARRYLNRFYRNGDAAVSSSLLMSRLAVGEFSASRPSASRHAPKRRAWGATLGVTLLIAVLSAILVAGWLHRRPITCWRGKLPPIEWSFR